MTINRLVYSGRPDQNNQTTKEKKTMLKMIYQHRAAAVGGSECYEMFVKKARELAKTEQFKSFCQ